MKTKVIGILCALDVELEAILNLLSKPKCQVIMNKSFFVGKYEERLVVAVKCGIGKVAASLTTTLIIEHFKPDLVISTGIAGGYYKELNPLDVVVATSSYYYDFDLRADGAKRIGEMPENEFPFASDELAVNILKECGQKLYFGPITTADKFASNKEELDLIVEENFKDIIPLAVDMETASVMQCAQTLNVPALSIRAISDVIGNHNQTFDYYNFAGRASQNASAIVLEILKKY